MERKLDQFLLIPSFARTELDLKGNELLVFGLLYGFCQDGISKFRGSLDYICEWVGATKPSVIKALSLLQEKNIVEKYDVVINGACKRTEYGINFSGLKNFTRTGKETLLATGKETLLAIQYDNIVEENIVKENIVNNNIKENTSLNRFKKPLVSEIDAYCKERNNGISGQSFYDFYESKGWKVGSTPMKDWKACVRTWEIRRKAQNKQNVQVNTEIRTYDYSKKGV